MSAALTFRVAAAILSGRTLLAPSHSVGRYRTATSTGDELRFACLDLAGAVVVVTETWDEARATAESDRRGWSARFEAQRQHDWSAFGAARAFVRAVPAEQVANALGEPLDLALHHVAADQPAVAALGRLGWELRSIEVDMTTGRARVEVKRAGVVVTLDASDRGATITRERERKRRVLVGRRGDRFPCERDWHEFLGRSKHKSVVDGLRALSAYVVDNGCEARLSAETLARLLGAPANSPESPDGSTCTTTRAR